MVGGSSWKVTYLPSHAFYLWSLFAAASSTLQSRWGWQGSLVGCEFQRSWPRFSIRVKGLPLENLFILWVRSESI